MIRTIWIMWKPNEERIYTMGIQPSEPWATTQKKNGYFIASFDVELPDPTVSSVLAGPLRLQVGDGVAYITEMSAEEAAIRRPGVVIPVQGDSVDLVGLCGDIHMHRDGSMWVRGVKIAQVTEGNHAPGYTVFLQFCSEELHGQIRKVTAWWFGMYGQACQGYPPSPGTIST